MRVEREIFVIQNFGRKDKSLHSYGGEPVAVRENIFLNGNDNTDDHIVTSSPSSSSRGQC